MLIIEGDPAVARLFAEIFTSRGWSVDIPRSERGVIEASLGSKPYSIILVSYRFPGTNGLEIIRRIRQIEHRQATPVLLVTGSRDVANEALAAGVNEVLYKPIEPCRLVAAIIRHSSASDCLITR